MHFEILVEDRSGKEALDILVPKILGDDHTINVIPYKGIGRIPPGLKGKSNPSNRNLLNQLPKLLRGYGKTFASYSNYPAAVIVVCDLDDKELNTFKSDLELVLKSCDPAPKTRFCIAIEEGESWFLGDFDAIKNAYPKAQKNILQSYVQDSICGAWEKLADIVYSGGATKLKKLGFHAIGIEKTQWAQKISPHMDVNNNQSPSFCYFRDSLNQLVEAASEV